jgi:hypothetical protein
MPNSFDNYFKDNRHPEHGIRHRGKHRFGDMELNHVSDPFLQKNEPHYEKVGPDKHRYPVKGKVQENLFVLHNAVPYLLDGTNFQYGHKVIVSESVNTRIVQRKDVTAINLTGVIDLTKSLTTNVVLKHQLEQLTKHLFFQLKGVYPLLKSKLTYVVDYEVLDETNVVVHEGRMTMTNESHKVHETEVDKHYVVSTTGVGITNIPATNFAGQHWLVLKQVSVVANAIDVQKYMDATGMNPAYQFMNNNQQIHLEHDSIKRTPHDEVLFLASVDIHHSVPFHPVSFGTKLKLSLTFFLSDIILVRNTFDLWKLLTDNSDAVIHKLLDEVKELKENINILDKDLSVVEIQKEKLKERTEMIKTVVTNIGGRVSVLEEEMGIEIDPEVAVDGDLKWEEF